MYSAYFGISEKPFAITPDPHFLFMSQRHREGFAHLLYGMTEGGGFVQLTGEVGTGKTTLYRSVLEQTPEQVRVALILNPNQTPVEFVASICDELHVPYPPNTNSIKVLTDQLNQHLLRVHAEGRRTVLIIDEAQNLSPEVLEQIRLLTNLETATQKLLQVILVGQPELQAMLARPELRQLAQRITARYHLTPLSAAETARYVNHRLKVAGLQRPLFSRGALRWVHRLSGGIPRVVNIICERALIAAYAEQRQIISDHLVRKAAAEVMGRASPEQRQRVTRLVSGAAAALIVLVLGWQWLPQQVATQIQVAADPAQTGAISAKPEGGPEQGVPLIASPAVAAQPAPKLAENPIAQGPPVTPPPPEPIRFVEQVRQGVLKTDTVTAFGSLFSRWGLSYSSLEGETACARAAKVGLRCSFGRGNWNALLHYNRPAVLELIDSDGTRWHATVTAIAGNDVTLAFGGDEVTLPRAEVDRFWYGSYILLWRPPHFSTSLLKAGATGPDVVWLRSQLDRVEGKVSPGLHAPPQFDQELKKRVMEFQRSHGVEADGIVGEQTLIQLNTAVKNPSIPVLRQSAG